MHVILVARYYPPQISGGARRPSAIVAGLRAHGAKVSIIAPILPNGETGLAVPHPAVDAPGTVLDGLPEQNARAASQPIRDTLRHLAYWPDPDIRWTQRALHSARDAGLLEATDWVITTSPPESLHAFGVHAKKRGLRWAADLRDSWVDTPLSPRFDLPFRRPIEAHLARRWLRRADLILAPTRATLNEAQRLAMDGPRALLLGQSTDLIPPPKSPQDRKQGAPLRLVHTGSFTYSDPLRTITPLLTCLTQAQQTGIDFHLHLIGRLTQEEQQDARTVLGDRVTIEGALPRNESLAFLPGADALILVTAPESAAVPGKLTEYRSIQRPILVIGSGRWRAEAGLTHVPDALECLISLWRGETVAPPLPTAPDPKTSTTALWDAINTDE